MCACPLVITCFGETLREVMGKFKGITSPIYNLDGGGDKKRQNYSKWIKCTVETLLLFLHVVEFGGSCLVFQSNHFFHTILDFSFNMSSFLFYLQGCCSSMYTCVCVINGRCGICRNWCTRRRYLRSGARPLGKE
jgi:hypothetical protein